MSRPESQSKPDPWWAQVLGGLALLGLTVFLYISITNSEEKGESFRMQWILAILYNRLGKWPMLGLFGVCGVALIFFGIAQGIQSLSRNAPPAKDPNQYE